VCSARPLFSIFLIFFYCTKILGLKDVARSGAGEQTVSALERDRSGAAGARDPRRPPRTGARASEAALVSFVFFFFFEASDWIWLVAALLG
jgi:hypothetical protein